jgi:hypothetical protein
MLADTHTTSVAAAARIRFTGLAPSELTAAAILSGFCEYCFTRW